MPRGGLRSTSFKKGQSGNPSGKAKNPDRVAEADARTLARAHGPDAVKALLDIMDNRKAPSAARVSAATAILDRGYGRPAQAVELTGKDGAPIETSDVSARELIESRIGSLAERIREGDGPSRLN